MRRTPLTGSAFGRLLAELNDVHPPASNEPFAERLSRWFDWTDAIPLSAALEVAAARTPQPGAQRPAHADEREFGRVRAALAKSAEAAAAPGEPGHARQAASAAGVFAEVPAEFSPWRRRYVATQQGMETNIAALRRRVRATLAGASPPMAKLAELDAVMEEVIGARERALLSTVPRWLERRFARLHGDRHETAVDATALADAPVPSQSGAWLDAFCQDMRAVLLAELDLRLQPVEGLLQALRRSSPDSP